MLCSHLRKIQETSLEKGVTTAKRTAQVFLVDVVSFDGYTSEATCRSCEVTDTINLALPPIVKRKWELKDVVLQCDFWAYNSKGGYHQSQRRPAEGYIVVPELTSDNCACEWENRNAMEAHSREIISANCEGESYLGPSSSEILKNEALSTGARWTVLEGVDGFSNNPKYQSLNILYWRWVLYSWHPYKWCPTPDKGTPRWDKLQELIVQQHQVIRGWE